MKNLCNDIQILREKNMNKLKYEITEAKKFEELRYDLPYGHDNMLSCMP